MYNEYDKAHYTPPILLDILPSEKKIILSKKRKFINEATHISRNQKVKIVRAQKKRS